MRMGYSCAAAAGDTLRALDAVCIAQTGTSNTYIGNNGDRYFYETSRVEHADGAITGSVYRLAIDWTNLDDTTSEVAYPAGNFRIDGEGVVTRWPTRFPRKLVSA